jgi:hypothetical protein
LAFLQKLAFFAKRKSGKKIFAKSDFHGYDTRIIFCENRRVAEKLQKSWKFFFSRIRFSG